MSQLTWGDAPAKTWESGISRGVLYPASGTPGVAWNGLVSVAKSVANGEHLPLYYDGVSYANTVMDETYKASISAYSFPTMFSACLGEDSGIPGLSFPNQMRSTFGLCYRTEIAGGHKLHLVYNATAYRSKGAHATFSKTVVPDLLEFVISADNIPDEAGYRGSQYYILDSRKIPEAAMGLVEEYLYGQHDTDPLLLSTSMILSIIESARVIDDYITSTGSVWSSSKIYSVLHEAADALIDSGGLGSMTTDFVSIFEGALN